MYTKRFLVLTGNDKISISHKPFALIKASFRKESLQDFVYCKRMLHNKGLQTVKTNLV
jgi:hypothetical protein